MKACRREHLFLYLGGEGASVDLTWTPHAISPRRLLRVSAAKWGIRRKLLNAIPGMIPNALPGRTRNRFRGECEHRFRDEAGTVFSLVGIAFVKPLQQGFVVGLPYALSATPSVG